MYASVKQSAIVHESNLLPVIKPLVTVILSNYITNYFVLEAENALILIICWYFKYQLITVAMLFIKKKISLIP